MISFVKKYDEFFNLELYLSENLIVNMVGLDFFSDAKDWVYKSFEYDKKKNNLHLFFYNKVDDTLLARVVKVVVNDLSFLSYDLENQIVFSVK